MGSRVCKSEVSRQSLPAAELAVSSQLSHCSKGGGCPPSLIGAETQIRSEWQVCLCSLSGDRDCIASSIACLLQKGRGKMWRCLYPHFSSLALPAGGKPESVQSSHLFLILCLPPGQNRILPKGKRRRREGFVIWAIQSGYYQSPKDTQQPDTSQESNSGKNPGLRSAHTLSHTQVSIHIRLSHWPHWCPRHKHKLYLWH